MKKRVLAGLLWFYATWYAWSMVASTLGLSETIGPALGLIAAVTVAGDPFGRIWKTSANEPVVHAPSAAASELA